MNPRLVALTGLLLCFINLFVCSHATAQISVDRVILRFGKDDRRVQNIIVNNGGGEPLHVQTIVDKMIRPGFGDQKREETNKLLVVPKRFSIGPNAQRTVRIVLNEPHQSEETAYRLKFVPVSAPPSEEPSGTVTQPKIKVVFSVGVLVLSAPLEPRRSLEFQRHPDRILFSNKGNVSVVLENGRACSKGNNLECTSLPANRLYPGNTWEVQVASGTIVNYQQESMGNFEALTIE